MTVSMATILSSMVQSLLWRRLIQSARGGGGAGVRETLHCSSTIIVCRSGQEAESSTTPSLAGIYGVLRP